MSVQTLIDAVERDDAAVVESLLAAGEDANARPDGAMTPLMRAAAKGNLTIVRALLRGGAEIDSKRQDGWTALILASFFGHAEVAAELLAHGADANAEDKMFMNAFKWAQAKGRMNVCALLKDASPTRAVPREPPPRAVGHAPGVVSQPQSAAADLARRDGKTLREAAEGAEVTVDSRRPARSAIAQGTGGGAPPNSILGASVLLDAGEPAARNKIWYYGGALGVAVLLLSGFFYKSPQALKSIPAAQPTRPAAQQTPTPTAHSVPGRGADPVPKSTHHAQNPSQPPPARTLAGQVTAPPADTLEPRPPATVSVQRASQTEDFKADPAKSVAVSETEEKAAGSAKLEAGKTSAGQRPTDNDGEVRVVVVPRVPPSLSNERRSAPSPTATATVVPGSAQPTKKKVIPWP